ncbi:hypothetical protein MMC14_009436 [Varicellaria rhodocarpa]|nr:hypothetical protein [Varicellaria rhodocarpa]
MDASLGATLHQHLAEDDRDAAPRHEPDDVSHPFTVPTDMQRININTILPAEVERLAARHRKVYAYRPDVTVQIYEDTEENKTMQNICDNSHLQFNHLSKKQPRDDDALQHAKPLNRRGMRTSRRKPAIKTHQDKETELRFNERVREASLIPPKDASTRKSQEKRPRQGTRKLAEGMTSQDQGIKQPFSAAHPKRTPLQSVMASFEENCLVGDRSGRNTGKENIPPGQVQISGKSMECGDRKEASWKTIVGSHEGARERTTVSPSTRILRTKNFTAASFPHPLDDGQVNQSLDVSIVGALSKEEIVNSAKVCLLGPREQSNAQRLEASTTVMRPLNPGTLTGVLVKISVVNAVVSGTNAGLSKEEGFGNEEISTVEVIKEGSMPLGPRNYYEHTNVRNIHVGVEKSLWSTHVALTYETLWCLLLRYISSQSKNHLLHRLQILCDLSLLQIFPTSRIRTYRGNLPKSGTLVVLEQELPVPTDQFTLHENKNVEASCLRVPAVWLSFYFSLTRNTISRRITK